MSWRRGALAVLLFVVKLVFFLYFFGGPSLKSEKKDPIDLHIAFGCSPSYGKGEKERLRGKGEKRRGGVWLNV